MWLIVILCLFIANFGTRGSLASGFILERDDITAAPNCSVRANKLKDRQLECSTDRWLSFHVCRLIFPSTADQPPT